MRKFKFRKTYQSASNNSENSEYFNVELLIKFIEQNMTNRQKQPINRSTIYSSEGGDGPRPNFQNN